MLTLKDLRRQALVLAVAGAVGIAGSAQAAQANSGAQLATVGHATLLSRGDVISGPVALSQTIHVTVGLKLRDKAGLDAFMAKMAQPGTGTLRPRMSKTQLVTDHLPTSTQVQAVVNFLRGAGFHNIHVSANNLLVSADASAATVQSAFRTSMVKVRTHDGRTAFANSSGIKVPVALQGIVQAVLGLQTVHVAHILARAPVQTQATTGVSITGHLPMDFQTLYGADSLPPATDIDVGIISVGDMTQTLTDFQNFLTGNSLSAPAVAIECIANPAGPTPAGDANCSAWGDQGTIEWDLDSQDIIGMSGGVKSLTFYSAQDFSSSGLIAAINAAVTENKARVIDMSIGGCERYSDSGQGGDGSAQVVDAIFETGAATNGQTFSISTGDSGSDECGDGQMNSASWPASSPWVVAAGGTTLSTGRRGQYYTETVWTGAGGSPSSFEGMPSWQAGVVPGTTRGLPDIAFDADPGSGSQLYYNGQSPSRNTQVGGTSLAAPLFTGAWARILETNPSLGFAAPHIYQDLSATDFNDVVRGSNGQYRATVGWDFASGFGSLKVGQAATTLSPQ